MAEPLEWHDLDEDALEALAERLSAVLVPGDVVVLRGEVGAGKTTFVRAAARGLGVRERVTSPTYQFARGYEGRRRGERSLRVNHLDLYRLEGVEERDALELDEYLDADAVTFVEWAEPALDLMEEPPTVVELAHATPTTRWARISGPASARLSGAAAC